MVIVKKIMINIKKENKMYLILTENEYDQYEVVTNHLSKPKQFKDQWEATKYIIEMEIIPYQLIEIEI